MRRKIIWAMLSCLMVAALVLGSCAPTPTLEPGPGGIVAPGTEKPKYGGTLVTVRGADTRGFDQAHIGSPTAGAYNHGLTHDMLSMPDWKKCNLGVPNGPYQWLIGDFCPLELRAGMLIESWEFPDDETIVYHVRQGVHFHDKPPTNGREMTAEDVAFSMDRPYTSGQSYWGRAYASSAPVSVTATDKYTVVMKTKVKEMKGATALLMEITMGQLVVYPKDAVEHYGDLTDWRNAIGTGPYTLEDYIPDSSFTFKRNPNYWQMDPYHPENRLPYPDEFVYLIVKDKSTRLAALRTARIDLSQMTDLTWEDYPTTKEAAPELLERKVLMNFPMKIYMRIDKPELPFKDIRVRRALNMAIDRESIVRDYWGGNAMVLASPCQTPVHPFYTPLEELPETTQDMYKFQPEKAKQLLAEAGYPDGFKFSVLCNDGHVDELSIFKAYFAEVGVDMTLDVKERGVYVSTKTAKNFETVYAAEGTGATAYKLNNWTCGVVLNCIGNCDQPIEDAYEQLFTWDIYTDFPRRTKIYKDIYVYIIDKAYEVHFPTPYVWTMWWPWVKNYHGEKMTYGANYTYWAYPWVDVDLKKSMGY